MKRAILDQKKISSVLVVVLFLISYSTFYGQELKNLQTSTWEIITTPLETISVSYVTADCNLPSEGTHNENIYLKFTNNTPKTLKVEWNMEYWYNGKCNGCEKGNIENHKSITLNPNETMQGYCNVKSNPALAIFSKMLNIKIKSKLTNFKLRDLKISVLND
jgi:hypothetical protein